MSEKVRGPPRPPSQESKCSAGGSLPPAGDPQREEKLVTQQPGGERGLAELGPVELDGFEVWDRTVHAPAGHAKKVAFVSVRVGGVIGANHAVAEMLGYPEWVKVMYDPSRRRLGLLPTVEEDENSYETGWGGTYLGSLSISGRKLFEFYGIELPERSRRYHDLEVVDGVLVVDIGVDGSR